MSHSSIDIVVVNWNSGEQLLELVDSIRLYHSGLIGTLIIVDNGSIDDSLIEAESLASLPFGTKIIRNTENRGFAAACNQGAKFATSRYLLFLNPDARLFENSLVRPSAVLDSEDGSGIGIVGIQLVDEVGQVWRSCARFPTAIGFSLHAIGLSRLFRQLGHVMANWDHAENRTVNHVIGAFFLVRRKLFVELHGFDERFFVYLEDLDFSYRAQQAGWSSIYLADVQAFHAGGGTSNKVKPQRLFYSLRSRLLYAFKHFSVPEATLVMLATMLVEPISRSVLGSLHFSRKELRETWEAYGMLWNWLYVRASNLIGKSS